MRKLFRRLTLLLALPILVVGGAVVGLTAPNVVTTVRGGFQFHDTSVSGEQVIASSPSLVVGSQTGNTAAPIPFTAFAFRSIGQVSQDIFVRSFNATRNRWELRGSSRNDGSLNQDRDVVADHPSIDFAGPLTSGRPTIPWVAWAEQVQTLGRKTNIFASRLAQDNSGEFWQVAGDQGGNRGVPGVNIRTTENADNPRLIGGATDSTATAFLPFVAWDEDSPVNRARQVYVARGELASGPGIVGGFRWQPLGALRNAVEPALNVDTSRNARRPDIAFVGQTLWAVWFEEGQNREQRIFAAKAVADATAQGGFRWDNQPACGGNEQTCALNFFPTRNALNPRLAAGQLPEETAPSPWVAFQEFDGRFWQVYVKKFETGVWRPIGDSLNVSRFNNATTPDIFFVGNTPHVAWIENQGGFQILVVKHLADARPGNERWDLDTDGFRGLNRSPFDLASAPSLSGSQTAPYVAWQEANRFGPESIVFEARRVPEGPAWGTNRPPFIRIISGTRKVALNKQLPLAGEPAGPAAPDQSIGAVGSATITTTCDHVNGWDNLLEIQFELADNDGRAFLGKLDVVNNKVFVEDPTYPGAFLGGQAPGTPGAQISTPFVTLDVSQMQVTSHGEQSAAQDMTWPLTFKTPTRNRELVQSLNIISRRFITPTVELAARALPLAAPAAPQGGAQATTEETGFFQVGTVAVRSDMIVLPLVTKGKNVAESR